MKLRICLAALKKTLTYGSAAFPCQLLTWKLNEDYKYECCMRLNNLFWKILKFSEKILA